MKPTPRVLSLAAILLCALAPPTLTQTPEFDIVIRGGQVLDGTGSPAVRADVGIRGDRIAGIGQLANLGARRTIDAAGLVVAPGFIDLHTHSEMPLLADGTAQSKVRQGVTLDIMGESTSVAPRDGLNAESATPGNLGGEGVRPDWTTFSGYFERLEKQGTSMNVIAHVASEQVRRVVLGYETRDATPQELARMKQLVARSMEEGAWGLVTRFESGGPEHPEEVLEMAKVVASYGGKKDTSLRGRLKKDRDFIAWAKEHGWWEGIVMARASTPRNREYEGRTVAEIAKLRGDADPMDTCINLMAEDGGRISGIFHTMSEDDGGR